MFKNAYLLTVLLFTAAIVLAVNLIGSITLSGVKFDMTEESLYSLSEGSENIVRNLEDHVTAELFYSKTAASKIPALKNYAEQVISLLKEYESASKGQFTLDIINPRPDTEEEEMAMRNGLQAISLGMEEDIYLGLILRSDLGAEEVIPVFDPNQESTLEYDVSKLIYSIGVSEKPTVGILSSLEVMGAQTPQNPMMPPQQQQEPWVFVQQLQNNFDVVSVDQDATELPEDMDLLVIIHPKAISDGLLYEIDQFTLRGGKTLVFVDANSDMEQMNMGQMNIQMSMQANYSSDLPKLMDQWGVEMVKGAGSASFGGMGGGGDSPQIVGDNALGATVGGPGGRTMQMPIYLELREEERNADEIITNGLELFHMISSGGLRKKADAPADYEYAPLLTTTDGAGTVDGMMVKISRGNPKMLSEELNKGDKQFTLAYKITGKFKTAFPDGRPAPEAEEGAEPAKAEADPDFIAEAEEETTVIVVADVDMISDQYSVRKMNFFGQTVANLINDNLRFLSNAIENLSGSQDLIALRSRGKSRRTLEYIEEIEQAAARKFRDEEKRLEDELQETRQKLSELQRGKSDTVLTPDMLAEIEKFRDEQAETQRKLRQVRRELREDKEALVWKVKLANMVVLPFIVAILGFAVFIYSHNRRRKLS